LHKSEFKISVVIPTYNRGNELIEAVKSALTQTFSVFEIIVCDDGSTDNSKQLITELNNPKVKWIDCGKNGGPAIPRNKGINESQGNWIAFLDSDDIWLPNKLEKQISAIEKLNTLGSSTNANRIINNKNVGAYLSYSNERITLLDLIPCNYVICSSTIINKELLKRISFFPEEKEFVAIEDYALWLRLSTQTDFAYISEPMVNYQDSSETSIRSNYTDPWRISNIILTDLKKWIREKNIVLNKEQKTSLNYNLKKTDRKGNLTFLIEC
jgi:teichuronic acid biosynthesis glycosyltransferase TuaG